MKTVGKRVSEWNDCSRVLTAGFKKKQHHCALLQLTTLANTGYIGFSRRVVEVVVAASCGTKDSGSLFAALPPIMAACLLPHCQDGQDGGRGSKQVLCR